MPSTTNFLTALPLVSSPRLDPYKQIFAPLNDAELYGCYLWAQHAAGALYPIIQALEVTLRNTIDKAARLRFGDKWWDLINSRKPIANTKFYNNIQKAISSLNREWEKKEKIRLGLPSDGPLPVGHIRPTWSHDKIVAATDFSTWQFALSTDLTHDPSDPANPASKFLWPSSLGKAFKKFHLIDSNPEKARLKIIDLVDELRNYRNRIFHHEPIWIKDPSVVNATNAVNTVRTKIHKFEFLLGLINASKISVLRDFGVFTNARRSCSVEELQIYTGNASCFLSKRQKKTIRKTLSSVSLDNRTITISHAGKIFGLYRIR